RRSSFLGVRATLSVFGTASPRNGRNAGRKMNGHQRLVTTTSNQGNTSSNANVVASQRTLWRQEVGFVALVAARACHKERNSQSENERYRGSEGESQDAH